jgi:hypothetical protein
LQPKTTMHHWTKHGKVMLMCLFLVFSGITAADDPPPPPTGHGQGGNQPPMGAPIDGGMAILLALGTFYGVSKLYRLRKRKSNACG